MIKLYMRCFAMKYDKNEEKEKLEQVNEELVKFMRDYPKDKLSFTAIGNSISDGFSMSEPGKLLLDRNLGLIDFGKSKGLDVQVNIIPVNNEYHLEYAKEIRDLLVKNHIRVNLDDRNEKLGYKLREAVMKKTLYNVVLGDKEINSKEISYRMYGSSETTTVSQSDFVKLITDEIASRTLNK